MQFCRKRQQIRAYQSNNQETPQQNKLQQKTKYVYFLVYEKDKMWMKQIRDVQNILYVMSRTIMAEG